jgi:hypothetical protein
MILVIISSFPIVNTLQLPPKVRAQVNRKISETNLSLAFPPFV